MFAWHAHTCSSACLQTLPFIVTCSTPIFHTTSDKSGGLVVSFPDLFPHMLALQLINTGAGNEARRHESLGMHGANVHKCELRALCWVLARGRHITSELETVYKHECNSQPCSQAPPNFSRVGAWEQGSPSYTVVCTPWYTCDSV